jgi:hypothetical protein
MNVSWFDEHTYKYIYIHTHTHTHTHTREIYLLIFLLKSTGTVSSFEYKYCILSESDRKYHTALIRNV